MTLGELRPEWLFGALALLAGAAAALTPVAKLCAREDVQRLHDMMQREQMVAA